MPYIQPPPQPRPQPLLAPEPDPIRRILVADDDPQLRLMVQRILEKQGYEVMAVGDGQQATECFGDYRPDLVLLDVMMPRMDGYQTAKVLKEQAGEHFVPIIFLTALSDDADLVRCLDAGGDGVLTKPFSTAFLQAEIGAMERMRKLYVRQQWQSTTLRALNAQVQHEHEVAERIFSHAVGSRNVDIPAIRCLIQPAATFNGDLFLTAYRPDGGLCLLLGDFTGHGLGAAIGVLPVSEVFHSMVRKGYDAVAIIGSINHKLHSLLPPGMFLGAILVVVAPDLGQIEVWNGGLPAALLLAGETGQVKAQLNSRNLPLGILARFTRPPIIEYYPIAPDDYLLIYSDGLIEARDLSGQEMWGEARLAATIAACPRPQDSFEAIVQALAAFTQDAPQTDDVSLIGIPFNEGLLNGAPIAAAVAGPALDKVYQFTLWSIDLHGAEIAAFDPLALLTPRLMQQEQLGRHLPTLQTVILELYNNALDHGILTLDSNLKASAEGFEAYYAERKRRLRELDTGHLRIEFALGIDREQVLIRIQDSGAGFTPHACQTVKASGRYFGRGLALVQSLCKEVRWFGNGNHVEAIYDLTSA